MIKHTKRLTSLFCALVITVFSCTAVFADTEKLRDDTDLFTSEEEIEINEKIQSVIDATGWDMFIFTNFNGVDGYDMEDYCNDYYDEHGYGEDGISLTIDMCSREMYIITRGEVMYYFNDERTDSILDNVQYELASEDYVGAADTFISETLDYYYQGKPEDGSFSNVKINEKKDHPVTYALIHYGIISLVIGVGIGFLVVFLINRRYKNNGRENTYDLGSNSRVKLTNSQDTFLTKSISVHTIQSSSSSSSGGGHSSGGGSSHGGGGRSF